jgi:DNA invertase Pin-like site-specific DNA recombinase
VIVVLKTISPCSSVTDIDPPPSDDPCRPNSCATKAGAGFKSLKDTWADTTTPHGRLMLTVLGSLAEFEGELIRARTDDGRRRAKSRGVKFGRPNALTPHQPQEAMQKLADGAVQADLARTVAHSADILLPCWSRISPPLPTLRDK